jgi:hypothetical protein
MGRQIPQAQTYKPKGYVLDADGRPTFKYIIYGTAGYRCQYRTMPGGHRGFHREVNIAQTPVAWVVTYAPGASAAISKQLGERLLYRDR